MPITLAEMMNAGREAAPKIAPENAMTMLESGEALAVDVRAKSETKETGKIKGAVNVPRESIEFRADPDSPHYDPALTRDKMILVYCNSGGRATLAGKTFKDMGYNVRLLGSLQEWIDAGGAMDRYANERSG